MSNEAFINLVCVGVDAEHEAVFTPARRKRRFPSSLAVPAGRRPGASSRRRPVPRHETCSNFAMERDLIEKSSAVEVSIYRMNSVKKSSDARIAKGEAIERLKVAGLRSA
jgi:hypothetical protein